jgi:hypothetical protein
MLREPRRIAQRLGDRLFPKKKPRRRRSVGLSCLWDHPSRGRRTFISDSQRRFGVQRNGPRRLVLKPLLRSQEACEKPASPENALLLLVHVVHVVLIIVAAHVLFTNFATTV